MRYRSWDVLLFPDQSRIPVQEFDAKCQAVLTEEPASTIWTSKGSDVNGSFESMSKAPLLTCFVASLAPDTPFRISIHSWKTPTASALLTVRKLAEEKVVFQARVLVDGQLQSRRTFAEGTSWPEVIDTKDGLEHQPVPLLFPKFHPSILQQAHWRAGEQLGRVRVTLSEGVMRKTSSSLSSQVVFQSFRDIVHFAFQHAPQDVLEYSAIAWPNAKMFESPVPDLPAVAPRPAAHAHGTPPICSRKLDDPFLTLIMSPETHFRSRTDDSMLDVSSTNHSRASTEMSVAWPRPDFQKHMDEAAIHEIIRALSPVKKQELYHVLGSEGGPNDNVGLEPPRNTPVTAEQSRQVSPGGALPAKPYYHNQASLSSSGLRQALESRKRALSETTNEVSPVMKGRETPDDTEEGVSILV